MAEPFLADPNFSRAVILLCEHGEDGTVGFVLNRPTELTLSDLLPELATPSLLVHQGGPVQMDTLHMLHQSPATLGGTGVADGIYWGGSYEALQDILASGTALDSELKLYVGYSGWSAGQLEGEMKEGSWLVTDPTRELLFETPADDMWKAAIRLMGREYNHLLNMPVNPQLN